MSERRQFASKSLRWAAIVSLIAVHIVTAQTVAEYSHRVDSLARLWRSARAVQSQTQFNQAQWPTDTVREGSFLILTEPAYVELAKRAAALVSPRLEAVFGASAGGFRSHPLVLRRRVMANESNDSTAIESGVVSANGELLMRSSDLFNASALAVSWQRKAEEFITSDLGAPLSTWLGIPVLGDPPTERGIAAGRVDLVLSPSKVARDCTRGDVSRCTQALGLVAVDDPAFALFDDDDRREMLERSAFALRRTDEAKYARCAEQKLKATCDSLVRTIPIDAVPAPLSPNVRLNFLRYALLVGGDGAFDRLAGSTGSVSDRIAAAARVPTDSLVRRWQATLMTSRSSSTAIDVTTAVSSILWAVACGALALRSSRWR